MPIKKAKKWLQKFLDNFFKPVVPQAAEKPVVTPKNKRNNSQRKKKTKSKAQEVPTVDGKLDFNKQGAAYLIVEGREKDLFVPKSHLSNGLPFDEVRAELLPGNTAKVISILTRSKKKWRGQLDLRAHYGFVVTADPKMPYDVFVPESLLNGAKNGAQVMVEITEFSRKAKSPVGKITHIFDSESTHENELAVIMAEHEIDEDFTPQVQEEVEKIPTEITQEVYRYRKDYRKILTLTIDPFDAKDFDDALSFRRIDAEKVEVGVHIADVSHYIKAGSALDHYAEKRGNSIYLVDRVIPMLPEKLSNEVCSLREKEEKLCFSAIFTLDNQAQILSVDFAKTVIFSQKRFTYEEAQEVIEADHATNEIEEAVLEMHRLSQQLKRQRIANGALEIQSREIKILLDENKNIHKITEKIPKAANFLIEEFMLLANQAVAKKFDEIKEKNPEQAFLYRVHDAPIEDKILEFNIFIRRFGYNMRFTKTNFQQQMAVLIKQIEGQPFASIIYTMLIKTMAKAVYSTENIGHYGLAFENYTHFTSPIRRYADLLVHRSLWAILQGRTYANQTRLAKLAQHISDTEKNAAEAERESVKYKQVEFMSSRVNQIFSGCVSGVTNWGIYVELDETRAEGLVALKTIRDDNYYFDAEKYCVRGRKNKKEYTLGDRITVKVIGTNLQKRTMDLELLVKKHETAD